MTRSKTVIVATLVCLAGVSAAYLYKEGRVTPAYRSTTKFRILHESVPGSAGNEKADAASETEWMDSEVALLNSPPILNRVVKALGLEAEWKLTADEAASRAKSKLEISADRAGGVVTVTGWGDTADAAAELANAVRDAYGQHRTDAHYEKLKQVMKDIEKQTADQQRVVDANRAELEAVMKKHGIGDGLPVSAVSGAGKAASDPGK